MSAEQLNALCDELKEYYTSKGIAWQFVALLSDKNREILTRAFIREKRKGWNLTKNQKKLIEWLSKWKWEGKENQGKDNEMQECQIKDCHNKAEWIDEFSSFNDPIQCINISAGASIVCDEHHQASLNCDNYKNSRKIHESNGVEQK